MHYTTFYIIGYVYRRCYTAIASYGDSARRYGDKESAEMNCDTDASTQQQ